METEVAEIKRIEGEYRKVIVNKQKMSEKKSENEMVMSEFKMLDDEATIFKMVGPVLAKQSLFECKDMVQQRITFIEKEIARLETLETEFQGKVTDKTNAVKKLQADFQKIVMQAQQAQAAAQQ
mmetsp:Transcript_31306/g.41428  ORF Transcript_31306/g.41428 Transcript_31306/m.41428 type:complete len:124 (+) Transcript_31306:65-436(+)|eukprot:CAMPEP_0170463210 /NCGR_PEP_ID=MMETSP0123-20130129/8415_1 /TAXON_ID=182087 /ORGANISM="Favella ehrenbergii, Strain Fehren 1" /LENGTH=123 /DNA_ID=CAMNT_0010728601 /DNA_START=58 /DNA_END=429 /DNA_ORIENTATION=+